MPTAGSSASARDAADGARTGRSPRSSATTEPAEPVSRPGSRSSPCRSSKGMPGSAHTSSARRPASSEGAELPPVARPRRPDAAPLARARRGRVLRHVLLRLGHALLSGPSGARDAAIARRRLREQASVRSAGASTSCGCSGQAWSSPSAGSRSALLLGARTPDGLRRPALRPRRRRSAVPLPHPSGTSRWLNDAANRAAPRQRRSPSFAASSSASRRLRLRAVLGLIEFPADDAERALRFWEGVLGVRLEARTSGEGQGWQTRSGATELWRPPPWIRPRRPSVAAGLRRRRPRSRRRAGRRAGRRRRPPRHPLGDLPRLRGEPVLGLAQRSTL